MTQLQSIPRLSASLLLIKEDMKILLMQRPAKGSFANMYAFPGGNCDKEDSLQLYEDKFKVTALRETFEEVGMLVGDHIQTDVFSFKNLPDPKLLSPFLRLITIPNLPSRYDTRYYIAFKFGNAKGNNYFDFDNLQVSKEEVVKYQWLKPLEALAMYYKKEIQLAPPQYIILNILSGFKDANSLQLYLKQVEVQFSPYLLCMRRNEEKNTHPFVIYNTYDQKYPIKEISGQEQKGSPLPIEMMKYSDVKDDWRNRIYFTDREKFFFSDYEVDVQLPFESPFKKLVNFTEIMKRLKEANLMNDYPKL